jgi:tetratricopeptide (TPR) repeat protein
MRNKFYSSVIPKASFILISLLLLSSPFTVAQNKKVDSLCKLAQTQPDDTNKVITLDLLSEYLWRHGRYDTSLVVSNTAMLLANKIDYKKGQSTTFRDIGIVYWYQAKYSEALDNQQKALVINRQIDNKKGISANLGNIGSIYKDQGDYVRALDFYQQGLKMDAEQHDSNRLTGDYGNIGIIYHVQGNYPKSLDYYLHALKIDEAIGDKDNMARHFSNIGNVYADEAEYTKALDYYMQAVKLDSSMGDKNDMAVPISNIGNLYADLKDYTKALSYFTRALKLAREIDDTQLQAVSLGDIGSVYAEYGDFSKALDYDMQGLKIDESIGNKNGVAGDFSSIGSLYSKTGEFKSAEMYFKKAIALEDSMGVLNDLRETEMALSELYDTTKQYKLALDFYKKSIVLKDTLFNKEKSSALARKEVSYQFEKKEAAEKAEQEKKDAVAQADKRKENIVIWAVASGLLLVLIFSGFVLRSLRITRKQKEDIEVKNKVIEEKNKEVLDSITYAKRLQDAILPPVSIIKKHLPESFIFYKPKDIVAGDFYWFETVSAPSLPSPSGKEKEGVSPNGGDLEGAGDIILIAACDCTGHGVPGAMVSVVCSNALNRAVKEFKIRDTGKVLDKVRELVLETFSKRDALGGKNDSEVKDGMDASFCAINTKTNEVEWSGAYNPLWIIKAQASSVSDSLIEIAPDKQPIGMTDNPKLFTTHKLNMQKGDTLYLFTDGYADQFGGDKGKKFKYRQLQQLIVANAHKPMTEQKDILEHTLEQWQGQLEQVDDILIMGIRI